MNKTLVIVSALVLCAVLALAAGCTQPATPPATPTPTPAVTTGAATPTVSKPVSSTPGPTQTLPSYWAIEVQVESNGLANDPQIITTVRGGMGYSAIQQINVRVTRSDGIVENGNILKPLKIGDSVSLAATNAMGSQKDRAEVWATDPQGTQVKIFDDYVPFRTYH